MATSFNLLKKLHDFRNPWHLLDYFSHCLICCLFSPAGQNSCLLWTVLCPSPPLAAPPPAEAWPQVAPAEKRRLQGQCGKHASPWGASEQETRLFPRRQQLSKAGCLKSNREPLVSVSSFQHVDKVVDCTQSLTFRVSKVDSHAVVPLTRSSLVDKKRKELHAV